MRLEALQCWLAGVNVGPARPFRRAGPYGARQPGVGRLAALPDLDEAWNSQLFNHLCCPLGRSIGSDPSPVDHKLRNVTLGLALIGPIQDRITHVGPMLRFVVIADCQ